MDHEGIILSEKSQRERDKYCTISLICGIFKKLKIGLPHDPAIPLLGVNPKDMKSGFR